jgi:putative transposase
MPRIARVSAGGMIYHVLNRGNARRTIFHKAGDARSFLSLLGELKAELGMRLLGYCLMGNHWHLVLWPRGDGDLSRFMQRLCTTHVRRYFQHYHDAAGGHLYQGRFKNFPVQDDAHLLTLLRYVEANPLRAGLVTRADAWRWSSLGQRERSAADARALLDEGPLDRPADWVETVNAPLHETELDRVRQCVARGRPYGREDWTLATCRRLGLTFTLNPRGRPKREASSVENQE